jgi:hypothetical protein
MGAVGDRREPARFSVLGSWQDYGIAAGSNTLAQLYGVGLRPAAVLVKTSPTV